MIIDLEKFMRQERKCWGELEAILDKLERDLAYRMDLEEVNHFHYLYRRTSADLGKIMTFAAEPDMRRYLESLVRRAYAEIHESRERSHRFAPAQWFFHTFPRTFRRHVRLFWLALAIVAAGGAFGSVAMGLDPGAKEVLIPFHHLRGDPSERVAQEEQASGDRLEGAKAQFSAILMTHNTKLSIFSLALGMSWGIGTVLLLFYNGVLLGAIAADYCLAGETRFLLGWLLPHGSIEIPAFVLAGQAGLLLAVTLIGRGSRIPMRMRLREVSGDLVTLICGVAIMLVWAGIVEAFLSQYHEPVIPAGAKIGFGVVELLLLAVFLARSGLKKTGEGPEAAR